jgi:hypothetical protein
MSCTISIMSAAQQKAQTSYRYANFESIIGVQREYRREYGVRPLDDKSSRCYDQLIQTVSAGGMEI